MNHVLDDYIFNNYVVIGVSAGPDSMCLLDLLQKKTTKIVVCHINHNVRKESIEEEEYITKYCQDKNIILEKTTINNYQENNFENEARKKRYMFYEEILKKYNSKTLLLAHHGDDLIETILMKISRGSNLEGYAGIKEISNVKNYQIIRPLLKYTKEDIINYNKSNNIKYYNDSSNQSTNYTRNRYRLNILPLLKKEDKNIHKKYENIIEKTSLIANGILIGVLIVFILGLSTEFIKENAKLADTLSLFSFALIFVSLTIQSYLDNYITRINIELERLFNTIEEEKDE